jgi:hypothetical protein
MSLDLGADSEARHERQMKKSQRCSAPGGFQKWESHLEPWCLEGQLAVDLGPRSSRSGLLVIAENNPL